MLPFFMSRSPKDTQKAVGDASDGGGGTQIGLQVYIYTQG